MTDLDDALRRVQGLLAVADDPATTPEAAKSYRDKAEQMMFKYRIEAASLGAQEPSSLDPIWGKVIICSMGNDLFHIYWDIFTWCARHLDCKPVFPTTELVEGRWVYQAEILGFEGEVRMAEMLFTSFSAALGAKLEPKLTGNERLDAYALRHAGFDGGKVAQRLWGANDKAGRSKARRLFEDECRRRGEDPAALKGNVTESYRVSYAHGFQQEARSRLAVMRTARAGDVDLVLASRKDQVQRVWDERFPAKPVIGENTTRGCDKCSKAKSGYCRDHSYLRPRRGRTRTVRLSEAGYARGGDAARSADLGIHGRELSR